MTTTTATLTGAEQKLFLDNGSLLHEQAAKGRRALSAWGASTGLLKSALQKSIRIGDAGKALEAAAMLSLVPHSPMQSNVMNRVRTIAVEDIGVGSISLVVPVDAYLEKASASRDLMFSGDANHDRHVWSYRLNLLSAVDLLARATAKTRFLSYAINVYMKLSSAWIAANVPDAKKVAYQGDPTLVSRLKNRSLSAFEAVHPYYVEKQAKKTHSFPAREANKVFAAAKSAAPALARIIDVHAKWFKLKYSESELAVFSVVVAAILRDKIDLSHSDDKSTLNMTDVKALYAHIGALKSPPEVLDAAKDMHTTAGKAMGRGPVHFAEVSSVVSPEFKVPLPQAAPYRAAYVAYKHHQTATKKQKPATKKRKPAPKKPAPKKPAPKPSTTNTTRSTTTKSLTGGKKRAVAADATGGKKKRRLVLPSPSRGGNFVFAQLPTRPSSGPFTYMDRSGKKWIKGPFQSASEMTGLKEEMLFDSLVTDFSRGPSCRMGSRKLRVVPAGSVRARFLVREASLFGDPDRSAFIEGRDLTGGAYTTELRSSKVAWTDVPVAKRTAKSPCFGFDTKSIPAELRRSPAMLVAVFEASLFKWFLCANDLARSNVMVCRKGGCCFTGVPIDAPSLRVEFLSPSLLKSALPATEGEDMVAAALADSARLGVVVAGWRRSAHVKRAETKEERIKVLMKEFVRRADLFSSMFADKKMPFVV